MVKWELWNLRDPTKVIFFVKIKKSQRSDYLVQNFWTNRISQNLLNGVIAFNTTIEQGDAISSAPADYFIIQCLLSLSSGGVFSAKLRSWGVNSIKAQKFGNRFSPNRLTARTIPKKNKNLCILIPPPEWNRIKIIPQQPQQLHLAMWPRRHFHTQLGDQSNPQGFLSTMHLPAMLHHLQQ
jgi:hypothetical protein